MFFSCPAFALTARDLCVHDNCLYFSQLASTKKKELSKVDETSRAAFVLYPSAVSPVYPRESTLIKGETKLRHRRRSIIREFSLNTSTHGLPGIARSESKHNLIFWLISFICFTGIMIYFVTKAILTYFDCPTQIDVDIISEWPQYFPAVSICNSSPFRLDRFMGPFLNYTNALNSNNSYNTSTMSPNLAPFLADFIVDMLNTHQPLEPYLYSLPLMLYKCTFNSLPCSTENFISFTSSSYGLCYTFNAKMKNSSKDSVRYGNQNGGDGVLDLELYVHSHQYFPYYWKGK